MGTAGEREHRLLLRGIQGETPLTRPVQEDVECPVRAGSGGADQALGEGHRTQVSPTAEATPGGTTRKPWGVCMAGP